MPRLDIERQNRLEPIRIKKAKKALNELGLEIVPSVADCIKFRFKGNTITFFPYSGWHTGKGIKDGRGYKKLFKQLEF